MVISEDLHERPRPAPPELSDARGPVFKLVRQASALFLCPKCPVTLCVVSNCKAPFNQHPQFPLTPA